MLPPAKPQPVSWDEQIEAERKRDTRSGKRERKRRKGSFTRRSKRAKSERDEKRKWERQWHSTFTVIRIGSVVLSVSLWVTGV